MPPLRSTAIFEVGAGLALALASERAPANFEVGAGLELALANESTPEWVQLMPAGPAVKGRDGRAWRLSDAQALIKTSEVPFALDYEHAIDLKAVNGEAAPAAGWVEELQVRNGQIWGRVAWTPKAAAAIAAREYRFLSPAFTFDGTGEVIRLVGGGLVNRPNFRMTALNQEGKPMLKAIATAVGLADAATEAEIIAAIGKIKESTALNSETLQRFVPRADYDLALNRATAAEKLLGDREAADHKARVDAAIEGAVKAGKVAPASRDYHVAVCATKEGLAAFLKFVETAPSAFGKVDLTNTGGGAGAQTPALNAEQLAVAKALGLSSPEHLKAYSEGVAKH